jgi:hypothetical protein
VLSDSNTSKPEVSLAGININSILFKRNQQSVQASIREISEFTDEVKQDSVFYQMVKEGLENPKFYDLSEYTENDIIESKLKETNPLYYNFWKLDVDEGAEVVLSISRNGNMSYRVGFIPIPGSWVLLNGLYQTTIPALTDFKIAECTPTRLVLKYYGESGFFGRKVLGYQYWKVLSRRSNE